MSPLDLPFDGPLGNPNDENTPHDNSHEAKAREPVRDDVCNECREAELEEPGTDDCCDDEDEHVHRPGPCAWCSLREISDQYDIARVTGLPASLIVCELMSGHLLGLEMGERWLVHIDSVKDWLNVPARCSRGCP